MGPDRILCLTSTEEYHAWGYLGPALLVDGAGQTVAELRGERAALLPGERFLLGLEGYDFFDTWMYDRNGDELGHWRSYGHYVVEGEDVRVVECDRRSPSDARVSRLLPDGSVAHGPKLVHGQVPPPVVLTNGMIVVLDAGRLVGVDRELRARVLAELVATPEGESWRFSGRLTLTDGQLEVAVTERSPDAPVTTRSRTWTFRLSDWR